MFEFLSENSLYVVLLIVLVCWLGIGMYLVQLGRKVTRLEQRVGTKVTP